METRQNATESLSPRERSIVRGYVLGRGASEIARELGCHRSTVVRTLRRPACRAHIGRLLDFADMEAIRISLFSAHAARQKQGRRRRRV